MSLLTLSFSKPSFRLKVLNKIEKSFSKYQQALHIVGLECVHASSTHDNMVVCRTNIVINRGNWRRGESVLNSLNSRQEKILAFILSHLFVVPQNRLPNKINVQNISSQLLDVNNVSDDFLLCSSSIRLCCTEVCCSATNQSKKPCNKGFPLNSKIAIGKKLPRFVVCSGNARSETNQEHHDKPNRNQQGHFIYAPLMPLQSIGPSMSAQG